jgi:hypothetical protein
MSSSREFVGTTETRPDRSHVTKTRVVLPDGTGRDYDYRLEHHVGDRLTPDTTDGHFDGLVVFDRWWDEDTMHLLVRPG